MGEQTPPTTDLEGLIARLRKPGKAHFVDGQYESIAEMCWKAADALEAQSTLLAEMAEPVAWLIEWQFVASGPEVKSPGGGSTIVRNNYVAVEEKVAQLKSLPFTDWVTVTPLAPAPAMATALSRYDASMKETDRG
jgi:hypothetical protein